MNRFRKTGWTSPSCTLWRVFPGQKIHTKWRNGASEPLVTILSFSKWDFMIRVEIWTVIRANVTHRAFFPPYCHSSCSTVFSPVHNKEVRRRVWPPFWEGTLRPENNYLGTQNEENSIKVYWNFCYGGSFERKLFLSANYFKIKYFDIPVAKNGTQIVSMTASRPFCIPRFR